MQERKLQIKIKEISTEEESQKKRRKDEKRNRKDGRKKENSKEEIKRIFLTACFMVRNIAPFYAFLRSVILGLIHLPFLEKLQIHFLRSEKPQPAVSAGTTFAGWFSSFHLPFWTTRDKVSLTKKKKTI